MATEGTSYGDVNYSVPEGADPLGIGVPDLGKSSYDPIATIRHGWENSRQERMMDKQMDQKSYRSYLDNMPTVEGVNQQITQSLNKDLGKMGSMFKRKQSAGGFAGFAKGEGGEDLSAELASIENKVASEIPIYNSLSKQYEKDLGVIRNGANKDKIDWKMTNANVDRMNGAKNVQEFAEPFTSNEGSLVVFRPEEADMQKWVKNSIDTWAGGMDKEVTEALIDPLTGKLRTTTLETKDQKRVYDSIIKGYANAPEVVKNEIQRMYDDAPEANRQNADGVTMEPDAWYASTYAPEWGKKEGVTQTAIDDGEKTEKSGFGYGVGRKQDGTIDLDTISNVMTMATPTSTDKTTVKRTKRSGEKVYNDTETSAGKAQEQYNTFSIPLVGFDKPFEMFMHGESVDTDTGNAPPLGKSAVHKAVRVDFIPTWRGDAPLNVTIDEEGPDGEMIKTSYTVKPGERMPSIVEEKAMEMGEQYNYEPYLMTSSVYGASIQDKEITAGMSWSQYVSRNGKTTIAPWNKVKRELLSKMDAEKSNPEEVEALIQEVYKQKNEVQGVF